MFLITKIVAQYMARVDGEDDAKERSSEHVIPVVSVIGDAADAAEAHPDHEEALQEGNQEEGLELWYPALQIPDEIERRVNGY
jgi:hypothetical protein